ncbi:MAG: hypothetical protein K2N51_02270 [Lachnospiraceae bacterium]|nr:hypothetical protein [Lachnospiraceae bacterium]
MKKLIKYRSMKKSIALLLVLAITCVYIIGDHLSSVATSKSNEQNSQNNIACVDSDNLRTVSELNLAQTDTGVGKAGRSLIDGYEELAACKNKKDFDTAMKGFTQLVSSLKNQTIEELSATDNGTKEYKNYRSAVLSGFEELENCISGQNEKNYETVLEEIGEIVAPEKQHIPLAGDLPFNNVSNDEIEMEAYTENASLAYEAYSESYSKGDLKFTNDVVVNDEIRTEFEELSSVLEVYQYIKNNYMPEFYYGSRKGSVGAFEEKAGNDYDLSSLLLAVLRDREIPAHYVRGEIEITAEQAIKWTAADNINAALRMISSLGIPVTGLTKDGDIVAVRLEHVWVEAYVPYTDYRGAGNQSGESLWIPLDVSFKELNHLEGIDLTSINDYINNPENFLTADTEMNGVNIGGISTVVNGQDSALIKYLLENGYAGSTQDEVFGGREIVYEDLGYLPLTLPYKVSEKTDSFSDIPLELTDSLSFSLVGNSAYELEFNGAKSINKKLYTPDLYGKRVVLAYTPASEADEEILEQYGGIFKTPAYLLKLKPQLIVDGEVVAEGSVCNAGYRQKYTINIHNGSPHKNDSKVENSVAAGGIYCIALDYGTISAGELEKLSDNMDALKEIVSEDNIYTDAAMGEMLNSIAKAYFAQLDMYNAVISGQYNVTSTRDLSIGIVGFNINVVYTFNRPAELNEGGVFLDIGHDVHSVVSNDNNNKNEKTYMLQSGIYASAMEHGILEQVTGVESVSTIKTFQYAVENNISFHAIAKENIATEISQLNVSEQIKQDIYTAVNTGKIVIIPEQEIEINQWSGIGYMVLDPDTFACGYMISGGLAGGAMTASQMIGEYIQYVVMGAVSIVLWEVLTTALLAMTPCGWLAAVQVILKAAQIIMLLNAIIQMIDLVVMYEETGDIYYLQELLVQVAACATLSIATKLLGNKLTQLKEKITNAIDEAGLGGTCFIEGTLILTAVGLMPIEIVAAGDMVLSFDPDTQVVSEQVVEETFVRESRELVHITVGNETISATPEHPFYVPKKGFVEAVNLRAGDILCTVNGEYVIVEQIQHEILETPIKVYNFRVANNHTYFVSRFSVGVHNAFCGSVQPGSPESYLQEALKQQNLTQPPNNLKQSWIDGGYKYEVRIHEGNSNYTNAKRIYRVSRQKIPSSDPKVQGSGTEYLGSDGIWYHTSVLKPNSPTYNQKAASITHIPLEN